MITFGSLFAGIGGFDLGLERAGWQCKWQVEIDDYARRVLAKHWPDVRRHDDIRTFPPEPVPDWRVDAIVGGFPCQDISYAGKGAGLAGERSGLFYELIRTVRTLGPRIVVLENVAALLTRGLDQVLGTLASVGFDAEWHCVPAAAVGAPHGRNRIWLIAYANSVRLKNTPLRFNQVRLFKRRFKKKAWLPELAESPICRMDDGIPHRVDRLRALGNAVVPQVAEYIGNLINRRMSHGTDSQSL